MIAPEVDAGFSIKLIAGPGAENHPTYDDLGSSLKLSGLHHVGLWVNSVDDAITERNRRAVTIVTEPHDVPKLSLQVGSAKRFRSSSAMV
jgi:hypothetical protein